MADRDPHSGPWTGAEPPPDERATAPHVTAGNHPTAPQSPAGDRPMPESSEGWADVAARRDEGVAISERRWLSTVALVLAVPLLLGVGIGIGLVVAPEDEGEPPVASQPVEVSAPVTNSTGEPVADVAEALAPSVVQLEVGEGLGSGVIYDSDGYILTAAHVVEGQEEVDVRLSSGTTIDGEVLGADEYTDIAVVKVDRDNLPAARLAVGRELEVGQLAVAIGSPFGLDQTVTSGIISAVHRPVPVLELSTTRDMIQTDAPINPGNSGGALADRNGLVIGINDAIQTTSQGNQGVGFAVPIDIAAWVADKIVAGEEPVPAFLGVVGSTPTNGPPGALITRVEEDTPAADVGLEKGDLVTTFEGDPIQGMADLAARIRASEPGTEVTLSVRRDDEVVSIDVELTELPTDQ
jgi:S1-C subfamily serine protease